MISYCLGAPFAAGMDSMVPICNRVESGPPTSSYMSAGIHLQGVMSALLTLDLVNVLVTSIFS